MKHALIRQLVLSIGFVAVANFFVAPAFAGQECECLGNGKRVKEGSVVCLQIGSSQRYLARCERNLNNTSWKKITDGCPVSQMTPWTPKNAALIQG